MKRITTILLAVMLIAALFISCENNVVENNIEETVCVDFEGSRARVLSAQLEAFNKDNLYWKYTAVKNDETGLNSGATGDGETNAEKVKSDGSKGLGTVSGFSQGSWKFTLYAYKTNTEGTYSDLQYQGTVTTSLKKGSTNSILVTVSPVKTEGKGTLKIDDGITITKDGVAITTSTVSKVYKVVKVGGTDTDAYSTTTSYTLDPGAYKVTVAFADSGYVYASGSVVATVYSNLTTTVTGSLEELRTGATFDYDINPDIMNTVAGSTNTTYSTLSAEGASAVTLSDSASTNKVTATVSASSAVAIAKQVLKSETVADSTTVSLALSVDTTAATESTLELEIGLSATVTADGVSTTQSISEISDYATVTINLQSGLTSVVVKHSGNAMVALESADATPSGDSANNGGYYYDTSTGVLTIKTKTFSPFAVSYDTPVYVTKIDTKKYTTLEAAIKAAENGSTITLLSDVELTETITIENSLTLDLGGNTITSGTRVFDVKCGTLTVTNGTISAGITSDKGKSVIKVSCESGDAGLVLEENATIKAASSYGISSFGNIAEKHTAVLDIYGRIESANPCLAGSGSTGNYENLNLTINVYDSAVLIQDSSSKNWTDGESDNDPVAVYQPNNGTLNIYGGTITSVNGSAVEIRAGVANISGGTFTSEAQYSKKYNGSGPTVKGAAIAVSQHTTKKNIEVTISGGTFTGKKQLVLVDTLTMTGAGADSTSTVENRKLVKAVVKKDVDLTNVLGVGFGTIGGDLTYYIDGPSGVAQNAGDSIVVNPYNAEYTINNVNTGNIYFTAGTYDGISITHGMGVSTAKMNGSSDNYVDPYTIIGLENKTGAYHYKREIKNLNLIGGDGVVISGDIDCLSAHIYGTETKTIQDPVRANITAKDTNNSHYSHITVDGLTISNFKFVKGGKIGFYISLEDAKVSNVTIEGCSFPEGTWDGTDTSNTIKIQAISFGSEYTQPYSNIKVVNCSAYNYYQGFYSQSVDGIEIDGLTVNMSRNGIGVMNATTTGTDKKGGASSGTVTIKNCTISNTCDRAIRMGIFTGATITVENNTFKNAKDSGKEVFKATGLSNSSSCTFADSNKYYDKYRTEYTLGSKTATDADVVVSTTDTNKWAWKETI